MRTLCSIILVFAAATGLHAQSGSVATQVLRISVQPAARLSLERRTLAMNIPDAKGPSVARAEDRFALHTRSAGRKISASLIAPLPNGSRLFVRFDRGTSAGAGHVEISDAAHPMDVATELQTGPDEGRVEYMLTADASARSLASQSRTIVYTLTD